MINMRRFLPEPESVTEIINYIVSSIQVTLNEDFQHKLLDLLQQKDFQKVVRCQESSWKGVLFVTFVCFAGINQYLDS
jgi:hypothetical protein